MAQNIYDDPEFFSGYSRLPRQVRGLDGAPEWPTVRALLPDLSGKRVVDLGCGFGWASRWMREQGAASVLGLDLSENMIDRARADNSGDGIEYRIANLEAVELPAASFDLAYSSLTFHYVEDFSRLVEALHGALVPGGSLIFTVEHPVFTAPSDPRWITAEGGGSTWPVNGYSLEGERTTDWFVPGVVKYHRTIGTTLNALVEAGFAISAVVEFAPSVEQVRANPTLAAEVERPMILIVSAQAPAPTSRR